MWTFSSFRRLNLYKNYQNNWHSWFGMCCLTYDLWHIQHSNGLSFEWMLLCSLKVHFRRNFRPQSLHEYKNFSEFADVSVLFSNSETFSVFNPDLSSSLFNFPFPCTWRRCWFILLELLKNLPHFEHGYGRYKIKNWINLPRSFDHAILIIWNFNPTSPVWLRIWFAKL